MSDTCQQFREDWFATTASGGASADRRAEGATHEQSCDACARWVTAVTRQEQLLSDLDAVVVPAALDDRVGSLLTDVAAGISMQPRTVRALRLLPEQSAPDELEAAVFARFEEEGRIENELPLEPWCVQGLRSVESHPAPSVLDRLVAEELADPSGALTRRFAGDLERPSAPQSLAARVRQELAARYRPSLVRAAAPFATAAAAALLVWVGLTGRGEDLVPDREYSFRVTYAESPAELAGVARGFASVLGGGAPIRAVAAPERADGPQGEAR